MGDDATAVIDVFRCMNKQSHTQTAIFPHCLSEDSQFGKFLNSQNILDIEKRRCRNFM